MISIIIPTYNEAETIKKTIEYLQHFDTDGLIKEIIISDGGSTDNTILMAKIIGVKTVVSPTKGRGAQMNYGAELATAELLYFLHADTIPPENFINEMPIYKGYLINEVRNNTFFLIKAIFSCFYFNILPLKHNDKEDIWL